MSAVIYDMDGVIAETESLHMIAFQRTMARMGIDVELSYFHAFVGLSTEDNVRQINDDFGLELAVPETVREKNDELLRVIDEMGAPPLPGIAESWELLEARGTPMSVASSSVRRVVDAILVAAFRACGRLHPPETLFGSIVGGDQAPKKKPHPDIYMAACAGLKVPVQDCIAIEDSEAGVQAAKAAKMKCIAIPSEFTINHDLSAADYHTKSMTEVIASDFYGLLG